jgi:hypothetical protein
MVDDLLKPNFYVWLGYDDPVKCAAGNASKRHACHMEPSLNTIPSMNSPLKRALILATLGVLATLSIVYLFPGDVRAAEPPKLETYSVYRTFDEENREKRAEQVEHELNQLAKKGWRVRSSVMTNVILVKDAP